MSAPAADPRGLVLRALATLAFGQAPTHSAMEEREDPVRSRIPVDRWNLEADHQHFSLPALLNRK